MNIYGVTGYPTPNYTTESHCRTFIIPNDTIALGVFMGALWPLVFPEAWQAYGDMTPDEAAAMMQDVIWNALDNDEGICPVLEAPYWDTYANADDEEPEGHTESWYGELVPTPGLMAGDELTWQEHASIWIVAGFIAYAGQPLAAIAFVPFARKFVLKFRDNPLGAIAEIFIDGSLIAVRDTYNPSDQISSMNVIMPDDGDDHTLWVAVSEDSNPLAGDSPVLQVVRKELSENEVSPTSLRYDSGCDCVQYTPDGGTTWNPAPESDARHSLTLRLPERSGTDVRCDSAANMVKWLHDFIDQLIAAGTLAGDILFVVNLLLEFLELLTGLFSVLLDLIVEAATIICTYGAAALDAAFSSDQYDLMLCIFYCNIDPDGSVSPTQLATIEAAISDQLNTTAALVTNLILSVQGETGLTNAGRIGSETGDCSSCDCGWCHYFDFTVDDYGFSIYASNPVYGSYVPGSGFLRHLQNDSCTDHNYLAIQAPAFDVPTTGIEAILIYFDAAIPLEAFGAELQLSGSNVLSVPMPLAGDSLSAGGVPSSATNSDGFYIGSDGCGTAFTWHIRALKISGIGDDPYPSAGLCP